MNEPSVSTMGVVRSPHRGRRNVAAAMLLVVTFVAGVLVGVAGDRLALLHNHRVIPKGHARFVSDRVHRMLTRELALTSAQQVQVREILERHSDAIEKTAASVAPRVHEEVKTAHFEIEQVLNPQQKAALRKMHARWRN